MTLVMRKTYLGDGVYVRPDASGGIVLTTENGLQETNYIVLEPAVWENLLRLVEETKP